MESNIKIFEHEQLGSVRVLGNQENPWFVGQDVATALGYKNTRDAIAKHVNAEDKNTVAIHDGIGNPNKILINESGVYSLIFGSKLERAKTFKHWVTAEVLPSIRKNGFYGAMNGSINIMAKALEAMSKTQNQLACSFDRMITNYEALAENYSKLADKVETMASKPTVLEKKRTLQADKFTATQLSKRLGFPTARALNDALVSRGIVVRNNSGVELTPQYSKEQLGDVVPFLWNGKQTGTFILWNIRGVDFLRTLFSITK